MVLVCGIIIVFVFLFEELIGVCVMIGKFYDFFYRDCGDNMIVEVWDFEEGKIYCYKCGV